jgi:hypothetical protein
MAARPSTAPIQSPLVAPVEDTAQADLEPEAGFETQPAPEQAAPAEQAEPVTAEPQAAPTTVEMVQAFARIVLELDIMRRSQRAQGTSELLRQVASLAYSAARDMDGGRGRF